MTEVKTPEQIAAEQAAAALAAAGGSAEGSGSDEDQAATIARLQADLKQANSESAQRRRRLKELEEAEQARQQAEMTETEKLKAELAEAKKQAESANLKAKETLIRSAFVSEASKLGVAHPEDVYLLADRSTISVDDQGQIDGVAEVVKALVDAGRVPLAGKPKAPNLDGGAGGGDRGSAQVKLTADEVEVARRMGLTPERFAAQKAAIRQEEQAT